MTLLDEWVEKAEGDYKIAVALNRPRKEPLPDGVCYHCQQCAEKYLKAYLISQSVTPPYIHDLPDLLRQCVAYDATLSSLSSLVRPLNPYSVTVRYPGNSATVTEAQSALTTLRQLRKILRRKMGL